MKVGLSEADDNQALLDDEMTEMRARIRAMVVGKLEIG